MARKSPDLPAKHIKMPEDKLEKDENAIDDSNLSLKHSYPTHCRWTLSGKFHPVALSRWQVHHSFTISVQLESFQFPHPNAQLHSVPCTASDLALVEAPSLLYPSRSSKSWSLSSSSIRLPPVHAQPASADRLWFTSSSNQPLTPL
jgi:hypothetical protein